MFGKLTPVHPEKNKNTKIKPVEGFKYAEKFHLASVTVNEFARVASSYPIVFIKNKETNEVRPVALFGFEEGQNAFVSEDGKWDASYVPAILRRYPFALANITDAKDDSFAVCVDEESSAVNEEEGQALFNDDGKPTEFLERVRGFLGELHQMEAVTKNFCELLVKHDLLKEQGLEIKKGEETRRVGGFLLIDEAKVRDLTDQAFLEFRHKGALDPIFAHLTSLAQVQNLIRKTEG